MSSLPPSPPPPPPTPSPPPPPPVTPKKTGFPVWGWLVTVVVLVAGGVVAVLALGGDDDKQRDTDTTVILGDTTGTPATSPGNGEVPTGITGTRDAPVPVGEIADIGSGWLLQVIDVIPDASEQMAAADDFYDPAPEGSTYMLVRLALGYFGNEDPKFAFEPDIDVFGASSTALDDFCLATVPDEFDTFSTVFSGGVIVGNACFIAPQSEAGTFLLFGKADFFADDGVYLDLTPPASPAQPMAAVTGPQPDAASTPARLDPVPLGTEAKVGDDWRVTVTAPARDITDAVLAENEFNDPPPRGYRYMGVEVSFTYTGAASAAPSQVSLGAVGSDNVQHDEYCGLVPDEVDLYTDLFAGGTASGTLCVVMPEGSGPFALFAGSNLLDLIWFATS